jgi:hypothetical protein
VERAAISEVLRRLAVGRPVFHSEADFQFAFAWTIKELWPDVEIRLETHPKPNVRLDLLVVDGRSGWATAIELKYMTRAWSGKVGDESFALKNQGASDIRCYDVVKDIGRVEGFVTAADRLRGYVIALTNDGYWRPATHGRPTNADSFRISEGTVLSGSRQWGPHAGAGTMRSRELPIELAGSYRLAWSDYSRVASGPAGTFRVLVVEVTPPLSEQ